jgi:hypothetical protein
MFAENGKGSERESAWTSGETALTEAPLRDH